MSEEYTGISAGVYNMRCTDSELGMTNGTETEPAKPQMALLMEFTEGPYQGQSLTWYGFFTEKTKGPTLRALRLLGWTGDDVSETKMARGEAPCTIQVEPDLEGILRARIRFIGGGAIAMKNVMTPEQKAAFAASMKSFAATIGAPTAKPTEAKGSTTTAAPGGEPPKKFF